MEKRELLYEGKAKRVYATGDDMLVIVHYKDDATAFNGEKKGTILGKGIINNRLSNFLFQVLEAEGIETHLVKELSDRETLVKRVEILPIEVIVRNVAAGSMAQRYGMKEGTALLFPVLEYSYKDDALGDPLFSESHILAMGLADKEEMGRIEEMALGINDVLSGYLRERGIFLADMKLEFGRLDGSIVLADEISPDTCRFWDVDTGEKLDKDRFRRDLGGVEEAYQRIMERIMAPWEGDR